MTFEEAIQWGRPVKKEHWEDDRFVYLGEEYVYHSQKNYLIILSYVANCEGVSSVDPSHNWFPCLWEGEDVGPWEKVPTIKSKDHPMKGFSEALADLNLDEYIAMGEREMDFTKIKLGELNEDEVEKAITKDLEGEKMSGGVKHDKGKPNLSLLSSIAIIKIGEVMTDGEEEYGTNNWRKGLAWTRVIAAVLRHIFAWLKGETYDPKSGYNHLAHACCGLMFLLEYSETHVELDDRYVTKPKLGDLIPYGEKETVTVSGDTYIVSSGKEIPIKHSCT